MSSDSYGSIELTEILGLSLRQLQWLDEREVLKPSATPRTPKSWIPRRYSKTDALMLAVISELRNKRVPLQQIREIVPVMRRRFARSVPTYTVFIPQRKPLFSDTSAELVSLLTRLTAGAYVIDTRELRRMFYVQ